MSNQNGGYVPEVGKTSGPAPKTPKKSSKNIPVPAIAGVVVVLLLIVGAVFLMGRGNDDKEIAAPDDTSENENIFELPDTDKDPTKDLYEPPTNNLEVPEFETPEEEAAYYAAQDEMNEKLAAEAALGTPILDENGNPVLDENGNPTYTPPEEDPDADKYIETQSDKQIGPPPPPEGGYPSTENVKDFLVPAPAGSEIRDETSYEEVQAMRSYRTEDCTSVQKWFMDETLANGLTIVSVRDSTTDPTIETGAWYFEATGDNIQVNAYCRMATKQAGHVDYTVGRP